MAELLKNQFFQPPFIKSLAENIKAKYPVFDSISFEKDVLNSEWENLELKGRMTHIATVLGHCLPKDYIQSIEILSNVVHEFDGFDGMVFPEFVRLFGLEHWSTSVDALELFTQYSSGEFAIRNFILHEEKKTMSRMLEWSQHKNHHVRRLSSEGCRPRLPWAMALPNFKKDPTLILPILENLRADTSEYVRKSVANNLNDITKDNPGIVLEVCRKWKGHTTETQWIIKHGLRSLIKNGNQEALLLLGYNGNNVEIKNLTIAPKMIKLGETVTIAFDLLNKDKKEANLNVDYIIHFKKANGSNTPKVFKLKTLVLAAGEKASFSKSHKVYIITTRKYYPGEQQVEIQVNGKVLAKKPFELII